jgi:hypothetical protein
MFLGVLRALGFQSLYYVVLTQRTISLGVAYA